MNDNPLRQKLLKLAEDLIDEVNGDKPLPPKERKPLADRIDVLKSATTLYLGDEKLSGKSDDEPPGRGMREWAREVKGARADA
jgi:hypothetical protein